ncbi:MAG: hypothetical protein IKH78_03205 [Ruminococcus sp.]|nr:hypothetical protein [Ruminococcus sp.]
MVENCFTVAVFCLAGVILSVLLKQYCSEHSVTAAAAVCAVAAAAAVTMLEWPLSEIRYFFSQAGVSESYIELIFKSVSICFITNISSELCRSSGEIAIASAAEMWGRAALTVLCIPVLEDIVQLIDKLVQE